MAKNWSEQKVEKNEIFPDLKKLFLLYFGKFLVIAPWEMLKNAHYNIFRSFSNADLGVTQQSFACIFTFDWLLNWNFNS